MNLKHRSYIDKQKKKRELILQNTYKFLVFLSKILSRKKKKKSHRILLKRKKKCSLLGNKEKKKNAFSLFLNSNQHIKYLFLTLF